MGVYRCPCYKTQRRGDTYVFTANLRTKAPASKWVLAGAVLVLEVEEVNIDRRVKWEIRCFIIFMCVSASWL